MSEKVLKATHIGELKLGGIEIPCAVLEDGTRVLSERSVSAALGRKRSGTSTSRQKLAQTSDGAQLPVYLASNNLIPFINEELMLALSQPVIFLMPSGGRAYGLRAELLPQVCDVYLLARDAQALLTRQKPIAIQADMLMRGLAQVGIIALVDEATGYQDDRSKKALQEILEAFIAKELQPWLKTFDDDFYKQIFRLNKWPYTETSIRKRPGVIGRWTNDIIYDRLAPGVKEELYRLAERDEKGKLKTRLFQHLTQNVGYQKLLQHIAAVKALMKASNDGEWQKFRRSLVRVFPKVGEPRELPFPDDEK